MKGAVIIDRPVTVETAVGYTPPVGSKPVVLPPLQGGQDPAVVVSCRLVSINVLIPEGSWKLLTSNRILPLFFSVSYTVSCVVVQ